MSQTEQYGLILQPFKPMAREAATTFGFLDPSLTFDFV